METGRELHWLEGHEGKVTGVAFSPDGSFLVSGSEDGTVRLWDVSRGHEVQRLETQSRINTVAYRSDGHYLAAGEQKVSTDGGSKVYVWEVG